MSISGLFLITFLLLHMTINALSLVDVLTGKFGAEDGLFLAGCHFMELPIVTAMVPVLALGFVIHIIYAIYLTVSNIESRGGYNRYAVSNKTKADSWASKNMLVLGVIVLGVIAFHLMHFWADMQLNMFMGEEVANPYSLLTEVFGKWYNLVIYLVWFGALWFHLTHGFWSAFQTVGLNNQIWMKRLKVLGNIVATIVVLGFVAVAIASFCVANCASCC